MDGEQLRRWRKERRWSQARLAAALGVYQRTVSQWESGAKGIRHAEILALALDALARRQAEVGEDGRATDADS